MTSNIFIEIDYITFKRMIQNKETFVFYLGGQWCKNCRAINYLIEDVAKNKRIDIYNLDSRDGEKESFDDFRKCNTSIQEKIYKEFIELLSYHNDETVCVEDEFFNIRDTFIPKISVPTIMAIKNGKVMYTISEEYEEESITKELEEYFKNELYKLINKL